MNTTNRILDELYFITTTMVDWVGILTRSKYKYIILDSLTYCQQKRGVRGSASDSSGAVNEGSFG
ncbi:hypothetical protein [Bacteroides caecigallinarum]|uniref:hypothetical protein n=1 Tax=Bacteroides caecigallinarum TaxID=1411144 RepID=UPI001F3FB346|nr:hypothetical protein [Bacteroides caecigallinarum]MCF2736980.1 hypothetical protein [Bacteroides caecigallinarum]